VTFGQWNGSDWDGFGKDGFVAPENPSIYVRVDKEGNVFRASSNTDEYTWLGVFAVKNDTFAHFTGYVKRTATAFEFKFVGAKAFTGHIELFLDTKASGDARNNTDYRINLLSDGTATAIAWGSPEVTLDASSITVSVANATTAPVVTASIPYAFFGQQGTDFAVAADEVIGYSLGQWMGSDWDGYGLDCGFIAPENPSVYVRIDANGHTYIASSNN